MVYMIPRKLDIYGQWDQDIRFLKMVRISETFMVLLISIQTIPHDELWRHDIKQYGHKMVLHMLHLDQMYGQVVNIDQTELQ